METGRIEAFSDGVIAIIITIMVLELKAPHGTSLSDLLPIVPVFLSYLLSFVYVGIYWNNHHHMFQAVDEIKGGALWANLHLLFWLSLIPFATVWTEETHYASAPVALYGFDLLMCAIAYFILQQTLIASGATLLRSAVGQDLKGKLSPLMYLVAMVVAFWEPRISLAIYVGAAFLWFIPDRRIENKLNET